MIGLEHIYRQHHSQNRQPGFVILKDIRGEFLRNAIGTKKQILDIGCRDGALTGTYVKNNKVLGIDIDREALQRAEDNLGISVKHMDLNGPWDLPENSFDAVVAAEVLEHIYYPDRIIQKIKTVLNSQGKLVGSIPNAFSLKNRLRYLKGSRVYTPLADPTHINHFSRKEFEKLLKSNFEHVSIVPIGRYAFLEKWFPGFFSFVLLFEASQKK